MATGEEPYNMAAPFEAAVVTLLCTRPQFYGRIGYALEAGLLASDEGRLLTEAAQTIGRELGHGPDKSMVVVQRLTRWQDEGRVTRAQIMAAIDYLDAAEDAGLMGEDTAINELTPLLQRRMQKAAIREGMADFANRGDMSKVIDLLERSRRLGKVDTNIGIKLGDASFDEIEKLKAREHLPTGIMELDLEIGGLQRGSLGIVVGGPGDGKSMFLGHAAAHAALRGHRVLYATLELPESVVLARLKANITGIPINALLEGSLGLARERLARLKHVLGDLIVKEFTPYATTVQDLRDWMKQCEDMDGAPCDLLIVDYGDKLGAPSEKNEYSAGRVIFEGLRVMAFEKKFFCWTASQAKRGDKSKKNQILDLDDIADSMHKPRVADLVVTLNAQNDATEMIYRVAKNRTGKSRFNVGPLPLDWEMGRQAPVVEEAWDKLGTFSPAAFIKGMEALEARAHLRRLDD